MNKYYLLGEIHGTNECPAEFLDFVKKNKIQAVALELPEEYQHEIDELYANKRVINNLTFFPKEEHDGRRSSAIKNLITNLKKANIKTYLIEGDAENASEREEKLAKNLSQIKGPVALLCGNVHAMKNTIQLEKSHPFYDTYPEGKMTTCAYLLRNKEIVTINFHAINGGTFYNHTIQEYQKDEELSKQFKKDQLPVMIKDETGMFDFIYLIDKFSYAK